MRAPAAGPADPHDPAAATVELRRRAARTLLDRLPQLTARVVDAIGAAESSYRDGAFIEIEELWLTTHESLSAGVGALVTSRTEFEASLRRTAEMGRRRAAQGLPLDLLLQAYRVGGGVFWQALVEVADERDPDEARVLLHMAARVWDYVDRQCQVLARSYRQARRELTERQRSRVHTLFDALLEGRLEPAELPVTAALLDVPERGRYAVVEVAGEPPKLPAWRTLWRARSTGTVGLVLLGDRPVAELAAEMPRPGPRMGISTEVAGLADVGKARAQAETALRTCTAGSPVTLLEERLPAALVVASPELAGALARRVLGPVLRLGPGERDVLLDTLGAWIDGGGSAARAAEQMFCHRNTVLNRLRRLERLTGRSMSSPRDAGELCLALEAYRLLG